MVRLKDDADRQRLNQAYIFQFHYGSVKSIWVNAQEAWITEFQFHYGSVKSSQTIIHIQDFGDFNSTMVRLKVQFRILL